MPKIREYNPTLPKVSPNDRALQAWETAGRRVGPLYNQAAQDIKEGGRVKGAMETAKIWPFDIYALDASNAPKVTNSTSNTSSITADKSSGVNVRGRASASDYDWAHPPVSPAQPVSGDADSDTNDAWGMAHGEASAGAVGMSRLARAAAQGHDVVNPNSDLPVDWKTDPNTNGQNVIDTPNGQFTPHQMDRFTDRYNKAWDQGIEKWNREQDAQYRREQAYWNGPNGWNTRRDKDVMQNDIDWQKGYDKDMNRQADEITKSYMQQNKGADRKAVFRATREGLNTSPTTYEAGNNFGGGEYDRYAEPAGGFGSWLGGQADEIVHAPHAIVRGMKGVFGAMFGDDEPTATADIE